jgi:hypothetical protein
MLPYGPAQVRLISEAEVGCKRGEAVLSVLQPVECPPTRTRLR